jgi:hypothetical protein
MQFDSIRASIMASINLVTISPAQMIGNDHTGGYDIGVFPKKFLAQGDSWFSIGHLPPWSTTNLLQQMVLSYSAVAVNCARPGEELAHMTDTSTQKEFLRLLNGKVAWKWDAILVSGGGNDLIDALNSDPGADTKARLLLRSDEWSPTVDGVARYISEPGWTTFTNHMEEVLLRLLFQRDKGINGDVPLFLHTYDYLTPRNSPAGPSLGPWLYRALNDTYKIPAIDWVSISDNFINRHAEMWIDLQGRHAARNIRIVDTRNSTKRATPQSVGPSNDWENEIHPTPHGYSQLAMGWRKLLDPL